LAESAVNKCENTGHHEPVHHEEHKDYYAYPKYKFEYGVNDKN
jgi:hypothetical protein